MVHRRSISTGPGTDGTATDGTDSDSDSGSVADGETLVFGNQGALWQNAMTWWDHSTGSVWSQPLGEAIAGPLKGATLELLPSQFTTWGAWRDEYPNTLALEAAGSATGFDLKDFLIVVDFADDARGYAVSDLRRIGVANDVVAGVPLAVVSDPSEPERWAVFARELDGVTFDFEMVDGLLTDGATGSTFDPVTGRGLSGPTTDRLLHRLPALTSFPGGGPTSFPVFDAFWPHGEIWRPTP